MTDYIANINEYPIGGDNFDCEWVIKPLMLSDSTYIGANTPGVYSLSSYLPNDNYVYMVAFGGWGRCPSGSGKSCTIRVMSGIKSDSVVYNYGCRMMVTEYHSTSTYACSGNLMIPIYPNSKYITFMNTSNNDTDVCGFYVIGYRRLGTNE